jgi:hypothetical protein
MRGRYQLKKIEENIAQLYFVFQHDVIELIAKKISNLANQSANQDKRDLEAYQANTYRKILCELQHKILTFSHSNGASCDPLYFWKLN